MRRFVLPVASALALTVAVGCQDNLFAPFHEDGASDKPEVLLRDAQAAMTSGDYDRAVDYLEVARQKDSTNAEITIELATAYLGRDGIDMFLIKDAADFLSGEFDEEETAGKAETPALARRASSKQASGEAAASCNFTPTGQEDSIDLPNSKSLQKVRQRVGTLVLVGRLLGDVDASDERLPEALRARALLTQAVSQLALSIDEIYGVVSDLGVRVYRLDGDALGLCADRVPTLCQVQQLIKNSLAGRMQTAVDALELRRALLVKPRAESGMDVIIDAVQQALDAIDEQLDVSDCPAS